MKKVSKITFWQSIKKTDLNLFNYFNSKLLFQYKSVANY